MALYIKQNNKEKLITKKTIHRKNILQKGTGLMFHKTIKDEAHIFYLNKEQRIHITMIFVFFPIDIIFMKKNKITEIKENLKPFTNYKSKNKADMFIELPKGHIKKYEIKTNQEIIIKNNP